MIWYKTWVWLVILPLKRIGPLSWYCVGCWQVRSVSHCPLWAGHSNACLSSQRSEAQRSQVQGHSGLHRETLYPKATTTTTKSHPLNFFQFLSIISCSNKSIKINICIQISKAMFLWSSLIFNEQLSLCSDVPSFEISCKWILSSSTQLSIFSIEKKSISTILPMPDTLPYLHGVQYRIQSLVL